MDFNLLAAYLTSSMYIGSLISDGGPILMKGATVINKISSPGPHLISRMGQGGQK